MLQVALLKLKAFFQLGQQAIAGRFDAAGLDGRKIGLGEAGKRSDFIQREMQLFPFFA